jgi:hypothetical protein
MDVPDATLESCFRKSGILQTESKHAAYEEDEDEDKDEDYDSSEQEYSGEKYSICSFFSSCFML